MDHLRLSSCGWWGGFYHGHAVAAAELVPVLGMNSQAEGERKSDEGVFLEILDESGEVSCADADRGRLAAVVGAGLGRVAGLRQARQRWRHIRAAETAIAWSRIVARFGKLHEKGVTALGKIDVELVLVDAYAAMIFVAAEHQLAVVPDLPGILQLVRSWRPALAAVSGVGKGGIPRPSPGPWLC